MHPIVSWFYPGCREDGLSCDSYLGARHSEETTRLSKFAVENDWSEFDRAFLNLKIDRAFVIGRVLSLVVRVFKYEHDVFIAADS